MLESRAKGLLILAPTGLVLLLIGFFWLFRQSRHLKLRGKERWWTVETALGSSVFALLLFSAPGFWYSRRVAAPRPSPAELTRVPLAAPSWPPLCCCAKCSEHVAC